MNCGEPGDDVATLADLANSVTVQSVTASLPDLLTGHQVCELLNISKSALGPWRANGTLQAVPFGAGGARTTWRYPKAQPTIQAALAAAGGPR